MEVNTGWFQGITKPLPEKYSGRISEFLLWHHALINKVKQQWATPKGKHGHISDAPFLIIAPLLMRLLTSFTSLPVKSVMKTILIT